ncbi:senescence regulator (Protein of unknown function, DUF584) [Thalictrum thalictroides]|uniref:Senescence regulator n=1 Tax=Thalictrum thalictroides TaxID=46969 RepID=A0A7J6WIN0_THATH|nr:senescence regulator (Protein of unknown function, DUF584) [Thalictrum thalictroides]
MASGNNYFSRQSYSHRFLSTERDNSITSEPLFEFDEADVWNSNNSVISSPELKKSVIPTSRIGKKKSIKKMDHHQLDGGTAKSLPMNVPDWSKILKEEYKGNGRRNMDQDEDGDDDDDDYNGKVGKIPPHEYLMARQMGKTQAASFSVHEGRGRTLKGRDLSRVRNAIWEKTGFED